MAVLAASRSSRPPPEAKELSPVGAGPVPAASADQRAGSGRAGGPGAEGDAAGPSERRALRDPPGSQDKGSMAPPSSGTKAAGQIGAACLAPSPPSRKFELSCGIPQGPLHAKFFPLPGPPGLSPSKGRNRSFAVPAKEQFRPF